MSNSTSLPQWDPAWVFPEQVSLVRAAVNCLGYGCFLILAIVALWVLIRGGLSSPSGCYLFAAVIIFLVSSTVCCAAHFAYELANLALGPYNDNPGALKLIERMFIVIEISSHLNYLSNDILVVWRAWVIADRRFLHAVLGFSMLITIGSTIAEAILNIQAGVFEPISGTVKLLLFVPLVFNNLLATLVVFHKTWIYKTRVKADLQQGSRKSQVERVLFLLIESGFIYCGWWVLFFIAGHVQSVPLMLWSVIDASSPFAAAIYPMLIILVVKHQKSQAQQTSVKSFSHSIQFNSPPVSQTCSTGTRSVSIIQSIVDIQSAQRRSSHGAPRQSTSQVRSPGSTSIIETIAHLQAARKSLKKEGANTEKGLSSAPHDNDLESSV